MTVHTDPIESMEAASVILLLPFGVGVFLGGRKCEISQGFDVDAFSFGLSQARVGVGFRSFDTDDFWFDLLMARVGERYWDFHTDGFLFGVLLERDGAGFRGLDTDGFLFGLLPTGVGREFREFAVGFCTFAFELDRGAGLDGILGLGATIFL